MGAQQLFGRQPSKQMLFMIATHKSSACWATCETGGMCTGSNGQDALAVSILQAGHSASYRQESSLCKDPGCTLIV